MTGKGIRRVIVCHKNYGLLSRTFVSGKKPVEWKGWVVTPFLDSSRSTKDSLEGSPLPSGTGTPGVFSGKKGKILHKIKIFYIMILTQIKIFIPYFF